jgi:uncharacterized protein YyaL (SSP411 family)
MARSATAAGQMLSALDFYLGPVQEIAVIGKANDPEVREVLRLLRGRYRPNQVIAWKAPGDVAADWLPLLKDREAKGAVTTYVCENFTCAAPLIGAAACGLAFK